MIIERLSGRHYQLCTFDLALGKHFPRPAGLTVIGDIYPARVSGLMLWQHGLLQIKI